MSLRMEHILHYDQVAATKYSTLIEIAKSIAQDTARYRNLSPKIAKSIAQDARYRKLSPSMLMVSSINSGILKTTRVDFDCTKLCNFIQNMMRFIIHQANSLAVGGGSAKEKVVNNPQIIPFVDGGDDIETAAANYNNTICHSIQRQLGPTLSTKNKANIL